MLRLWLCLIVMVLTAPASAFSKEPMGRCWVAAVAMNQENGATEDWNQYAEEIALVFTSQPGTLFAKVSTRTVVGKRATLSAIQEAVRWAFLNARVGDLVVVYIDCHGGTEPRDGWSIDTMDEQVVYGRDLKEAAAKVPCPVLFIIDTCGSGGFARPRKRDVPLPDNCAAICSCRAKQSTTNVLNIAMHEALWGAADANDDDCIEMSELKSYLEQRCSRIAPQEEGLSKESEMPIIEIGSGFASDLRLTQHTGELVAVLHDRAWHLARVLGSEDRKVRVHVMGYQDDPEKSYFYFNEVPEGRVFQLDDTFVPVMVAEGDKAVPAIVTKQQQGKVTVKYPLRRAAAAEEEVDRSAIRFPFPLSHQPM